MTANWSDSIPRDLIPEGFALPHSPPGMLQLADFWEEAGQPGKAARLRSAATFWSRNEDLLSPVQLSVLQKMRAGWALCTTWRGSNGNRVFLLHDHDRLELQFRTFYALLNGRLIEPQARQADDDDRRTDFILTALGREAGAQGLVGDVDQP